MSRAVDLSLPGLKRMKAATPPGLCPFCLEPAVPLSTKPGSVQRRRTQRTHQDTCGDEICRIAWFRCWRRDHRKTRRRS